MTIYRDHKAERAEKPSAQPAPAALPAEALRLYGCVGEIRFGALPAEHLLSQARLLDSVLAPAPDQA